LSIEQKQRLYLAITMVLVTAAGIAISLYFSYEASFEEKRSELINIVKSRARIMESIAEFDARYSSNFPGGTTEATLTQIRNAHDKFEGFGETGEFTLAKLEDDQIVFLLRHRHSTTPAIPLNSTFAEPMRIALKGESGTIVGLDYRGKTVLAAYEPVAVLNLGLVAKIDLTEIKAPFIKAGVLALIGGAIAILVGLVVFFRLSEPLLRSITNLQEQYERAIKGSKDGLWDWPDINKDEQWWSDDWYGLLGYQSDEIRSSYSNYKSQLHPDDLPRMEEALKNHFYGQALYDTEYRLKHKSGEYKWFRGRGAVQRDKNGKSLRMSGSISDIHQSKQDREAIDRLSQVAQQVPISVLITNEKGHIEYVNEALTRLSGYSKDEILGQNPRMFKSGASPDTYYKVLWKTISQGKEWRGVFHNKKKSGELYWESVLIFPLKDINGKVSNFIGLKEDITEKKQLESTLIDHERLIRSVVNNLKDGLIISNVDGNIQLFNKGAEKIFGYKAEEVMDKPVSILMDEFNKKKHDIGFTRFKERGAISPNNTMAEVEGLKKDGTPVPIELTLTAMEQRGELLVIGMVRNISKRKEAEKQRQEKEDQLQMVTEAAQVYFWDWKINTSQVIHDPRWIEFLGYSKDEFENTLMHCKELIHPNDLPRFEKAIDDHIMGATEYFYAEYRTLKKTGEWVWTLDKGKILEKDEDGKPLRAYGTFQNIQKRKEADKKIEQVQKQLVAAEKLAGVGELAAGVSHEVLNPVNIISVHTQMLQRKTKDDSNIQNFCEKIKHEIDRIQKIMSSLLEFSRKGNSEVEKGYLAKEIEKTLVLVEEEYKFDNIKIVRNWCENYTEVLFDADKIRQVYLNLLQNAKHAMPDGGIITVGCKPAKDVDKKFHQFTFSDTGTGMTDEVKLKVFEPFFTTKPEGEGTGMGMAVIHGIVEEHNGKIRVESEEGKGTTFIISLPIA
jgi:PAS domain S-box-containing protein